MSCIDAAAQVLKADGGILSTVEMIERMASEGLWTSPGGKTPDATLYAAIIRDNAARGQHARFIRIEKNRFRHA